MKSMKKVCALAAAVMAAFSLFASEMPLAEARAKIGEAVANSQVMAQTMKSLSADNQKAFLSEVNAAISKMPGSTESKTATFLTVNRTALQNAAKGNMKTLLAEVFATVPVEALTVLNESFAKDLFNRKLSGNDKLSDAQFEKIARDVVQAVGERASGLKDADVRMAFTALMFIRSSNGSPANLTDNLVSVMPEKSREVAKSDWLPAALGQNQDKTYDPLLGGADAGREPDVQVVMNIAGSIVLDALLAELVEGVEMIDPTKEVEMPLLDADGTIPVLTEPHGYRDTSTGLSIRK